MSYSPYANSNPPPPEQWSLNHLIESSLENQDLNVLVNGLPLSEYQFNTRADQPQSSMIGSVFAAKPIICENPQFALAQPHYTHPPPPKPSAQQVAEYTEELLFYLIYGPQYEPTTANSLRYAGLKNIFSRNWLCLQPLPTTTVTTVRDDEEGPQPADGESKEQKPQTEKQNKEQPTLVWALNCAYDVVFQDYLHMDVNNGLLLSDQYPPLPGVPPAPPAPTPTTSSSKDKKSSSKEKEKEKEANKDTTAARPALYLLFYPQQWQFQFQAITLNQFKILTIEDVLR